jgi:NADH dehydrogenase [ubiquinone] 1 alpha subcomplex assembly factor 7
MATCLGDPEHGYYMQKEPFGSHGDFITAPEVSQMFGELVGLWAVATWERIGEPAAFVLAELGPGRGTLMADIIRTAHLRPAFLEAAQVHLVETSPRLREVQKATLSPTGMAVHWHGRVEDIPRGPTVFLANEFFDALPVRQFQWDGAHWNERVVGLDDQGGLTLGLKPVDQRPLGAPLPKGAIIEASPASGAIVATIGERIARDGGAALIIDFGSDAPGTGNTLQAVRQHKYADPLAEPGEADLTAHVDFAALTRAADAAGAECRQVISQGEFLVRMGLVERANVLGRGKTTKTRDAIAAAMERLAGKKAMGELFKVLAISTSGVKLPIFDADNEPSD